MTEQEWLECTDSMPMLDFVWSKTTERKLRLFACACCRRLWPLFEDGRSRTAIEVCERFADQQSGVQELADAVNDALLARNRIANEGTHIFLADAVLGAVKGDVYHAAQACGWEASYPFEDDEPSWQYSNSRELDEQSKLMRCIFTPFGTASLDPSWLVWSNGTVPKIAQTISEERRYEDMPILADALEEAGCTDADILRHCRSKGPHVRGCWVVDLILGRR